MLTAPTLSSKSVVDVKVLTALYNSFLYLIFVLMLYVVFLFQSTTVDVLEILSNFIVVLKSLTRSLPRLAYALAGSEGAEPSFIPPVSVTVGVVEYPNPIPVTVIEVTTPPVIVAVAVAVVESSPVSVTVGACSYPEPP